MVLTQHIHSQSISGISSIPDTIRVFTAKGCVFEDRVYFFAALSLIGSLWAMCILLHNRWHNCLKIKRSGALTHVTGKPHAAQKPKLVRAVIDTPQTTD